MKTPISHEKVLEIAGDLKIAGFPIWAEWLLAYIAANEAASRAIPQAIAALEELLETGNAIGGYSEEEGHESPQADFLRALNKGAAALAALKQTQP